MARLNTCTCLNSPAPGTICRYEASDAKAEQPAPLRVSDSTADHVLVMDSFLEDETASGLRGTFHDRFSKPREGNPDRFVWDWWHVPDQYTLVRPQANWG